MVHSSAGHRKISNQKCQLCIIPDTEDKVLLCEVGIIIDGMYGPVLDEATKGNASELWTFPLP